MQNNAINILKNLERMLYFTNIDIQNKNFITSQHVSKIIEDIFEEITKTIKILEQKKG